MNRVSSTSIQRQLQLFFVLTLGFTVLFMGGAWIVYNQVLHEQEAERMLTVEGDIIGAAVRPALLFNDRRLAGEMLQNIRSDLDISEIKLFTEDGKTLFTYHGTGVTAVSVGQAAFQSTQSSKLVGGRLRMYRVVKYKNKPVGVIYLESSLYHLKQIRFAGLMTVLAAMIVCLTLGLVLASRLQKKIAGPISSLASLMRCMTADRDFSLRTKIPAFNSETEALLTGFNQMAEEVENSFMMIEEKQVHLQQSEARFRNIVELAPVPVLVSRASNGHLLFYNQTAAKLFGVDAIKQKEFNALDFYRHPEDRQMLMQILKKQGELHGQELEVVRPDGVTFWISLSMSAMRFEGEMALFSALVDITEQKTIEQVLAKNNQVLEQRVFERTAELQAAKNELQSTLDNMIDTYFRIHTDGVMQWASASVFPLLGYQVSEISNMPVKMLSVDDQGFPQLAEALAEHPRMVMNQQVQLRHKSGHTVWVSVSAHLMVDDQAESACIEGVVRDISQLIEAEEQKRQMEKKMTHMQRLKSLGILAGGIAHDFNNILAGIMGNAELAEMNALDGRPVQQQVKNIITGSSRAADLCKQMLAYSGQGAFMKSNVNMSTLVEETLQLIDISISKNISLHLDLPPALAMVYADKTQIQQIIMNLVSNAAESIGDESQGHISIVSELIDADAKTLESRFIEEKRNPGAYMSLEVTDSGCGMNDVTMDKIFDPFFTTKFTGRGLGMSAVLGIVRAHGGTIQVYSNPGRGSRFRILLPVSPETQTNPVESSNACIVNHKIISTVLVVDDEMMVRVVVEGQLKRLGCKVILASNGVEAVDVCRERGQEIGLVLLDMTMPRMGGKAALEKLRALNPSLPVIICSGYSHERVAGMFDKVQPNGFLQKPFSLKVLNEILTNFASRA